MRITSLLILPLTVLALELDITSYESIQKATALLSSGLMDYYHGDDYGGVIGMFTNPYYWWEAGGAWGSMLDHWYYLENDTYHDIIYQALLYQTGEDYNYMPLNQTTSEGNDDQAFWGIAAIQAAERNFTNPTDSGVEDSRASWLYLAQAVFNTMAWRWDSACGGGLRWQIFQWNAGYDYKNTVSNAGLFHIGARLARYTSNDTYVEWAEKTYDWLVDVDFLDEGDDYWFVYDGASTSDNCTSITKLQWTYNIGLVLSGCAYLYNYTEEEIWLTRTERYLHGAQVFFNNSIMYEAACQPSGNCNNDQRSFKAYFSRFLSLTSIMAPTTYDTIRSYIEASAQGAAQSCSGGTDGHTCGTNWFAGGWDGNYGLGEQMAALEIIQNLLAPSKDPPYTASSGGSSTGDGAAGSQTEDSRDTLLTLNNGDKAGASIITCIFGSSIIALGTWLIV